nr:GNAT family N-acetyltransferase [Bordetella sp. 15P40C-2]
MTSGPQITKRQPQFRLLTREDITPMRRLREVMLTNSPECFHASVADEAALSDAQWASRIGPDEDAFIVGAFLDGELMGTVGAFRNHARKTAHKVTFWGVYMDPDLRGSGAAETMLTMAIEQTRKLDGIQRITLTLTGSNTRALRLYERLGFQVYGEEPDALLINGTLYAEKLMSLDLGVALDG